MRRVHAVLLTLGLAGLVLPAALRAAPEPMKLGVKPANFTLSSPDGAQYRLFTEEKPKATVVIFIATQCPISNAYNGRMAEIGKEYQARGVRFIAVNSNKQEPMAEVGDHAKRNGFPFPVVKDPNNVIADQWGALVTPEAFVLDAGGVLQYHGRVDDSQNPARITSHDLKDALDAVLAGRKPERPETKALGCTIKRI